MNVYQCCVCSHYYTEKATIYRGVQFDQLPNTYVCQRPYCPGEGIVGICLQVEKTLDEIVDSGGQVTQQKLMNVSILYGASGSTAENVFEN